ncbi:MAG: hypothetical protein QOG85_1437 [Gaiellaceae bacterium]|jgi:hypothetical protein|nr:hypothetical protein [Gaiellaceae bacterium]
MRIAAFVALAFLVAGCAVGGTKTTTVTSTLTRTVTSPQEPSGLLAETDDVKYFGTPVSVTRIDAKRYALAIQPKLFLVGVTANVAFAAGQGSACQPLECAPVDNDHWVMQAGTQALVFILRANTMGTVLTQAGGPNAPATITAAQLSAIVGGASTPQLYEPLDSGLWVTVHGDTVKTFSQQYQP